MQHRWQIDAANRTLRMDLRTVSADELGDLLFLQDELSEDLLDALELHQPGYLERRATLLLDRLAVILST
jgi:hypothetical protein